jgi:hypothetical protein
VEQAKPQRDRDCAGADDAAAGGETVGAPATDEQTDILASPASLAQQRFWLLTKVNPDGTAFNMPSTVRLQGALSISHLRRSFSLLVQRHEILRTTFREVDGELLQVITPIVGDPLAVSDLGVIQAEAAEVKRSRSCARRRNSRSISKTVR